MDAVRSNPRSDQNPTPLWLLALCALVALAGPARAQPPPAEGAPPDPDEVDLDEAPAEPAEPKAEPKAVDAEPAPAAPPAKKPQETIAVESPTHPEPTPPTQAQLAQKPSSGELAKASPGAPPWAREGGWYRTSTVLSWHGGLELDVGYAKYTFSTITYKPEEFFDFRGRFVLGPDVRYDFGGGDYFFRGRAEFVAWVREQYNLYQINVDDVYGQVGQYGLWDFQIGRFMTWRVYRKGLGFDLFTLEQTGALVQGPFEGGRFGVQTYEVDNIFYRETPGRAAVHLYPTSWSGIEIAGQYGKDGTANTAGGRVAGNIHTDYVSVSAGGEYRFFRPAIETSALAPDGTEISCDRCGIVKRSGFGGGIVATFKPIEAGVNASRGQQQSYSIKDGTPDKNAFFTTYSMGGYLELDAGSVLVDKSLILGGGVNRTERLYDNNNFESHIQGAVYAGYPLGFNNAMVKLVISAAEAHVEEDTGDGVTFLGRDSVMFATRVRLSFNF